MSKSISDYFAMWKMARALNERYASDMAKENLADEQFVIQQHAMLMMTKTPAANEEEIRMKLRVATCESGNEASDAGGRPADIQLKIQLLQELDALIANGVSDLPVEEI